MQKYQIFASSSSRNVRIFCSLLHMMANKISLALDSLVRQINQIEDVTFGSRKQWLVSFSHLFFFIFIRIKRSIKNIFDTSNLNKEMKKSQTLSRFLTFSIIVHWISLFSKRVLQKTIKKANDDETGVERCTRLPQLSNSTSPSEFQPIVMNLLQSASQSVLHTVPSIFTISIYCLSIVDLFLYQIYETVYR